VQPGRCHPSASGTEGMPNQAVWKPCLHASQITMASGLLPKPQPMQAVSGSMLLSESALAVG